MRLRPASILTPFPILAAASLVCVGPARAAPADQSIALPLFGKTITFRVPPAYTAQPAQLARGQFLLEFLRDGETFATWRTLLTVRGFQGFGGIAKATPDLARAIFEPRACPSGAIFEAAPPEQTAGGMELTYIAIGCADTPANAYAQAQAGSGEIDVIALYRDAENLYSVQYAVRGPSFRGGKPPLSLADARATLARTFGPVAILPTPAAR